jgi:two-component system NtrC family response regulator
MPTLGKSSWMDGTFREDLFYRLAVVKIPLPPLREREDDIRLLAHYFLQRFSGHAGKAGLAFEPEAMRALSRNPWPGNVRQLENCIRRAVIMAEGKRLTVRDLELPAASSGSGQFHPQRCPGASGKRDDSKRLAQARRQNCSRRRRTGRRPANLYDLMDKLGIPRDGATPSGHGNSYLVSGGVFL